MAHVNADRVKETSTTTGTGTYNLDGASTGFQTFVAGIGNGNTCDYLATNNVDWESGQGTVTDATPDTLARTTIYASSNAGSAVNWGAGTKTLFCAPLGGRVLNKLQNLSDLDNAATAFGNIKQAATDAATGVVEIAVQSEMEAGSDTGRAVVPGRQHFHPSASKCWGQTTGAGTPTLSSSYNMTSITDTGTGQLTATIATDFSSANYSCVSTSVNAAGSVRVGPWLASKAAGSIVIELASTSFAYSDPGVGYDWSMFGDL